MSNENDLASGATIAGSSPASEPAAAGFRSKDGTDIGFLTVGSGPAVIVIPGALSTAADYGAFAGYLAQTFTVHTLERRGRGSSGPQGDDYSIVKERADTLALQALTGSRFLVGHSFGGLVALEAARRNRALDRIAVYEPGVSVDGSIPMSWMPAYEASLAEGKELDAFVEFVIGVGPDRSRKAPRWLMKLLLPLFIGSDERRRRFALLAENLREHREVGRLDNSYRSYAEIPAGVLLLHGGKSDSRWARLAIERLAEILPRSETTVFPRLDHFGIDRKAPGEVARRVSDYFLR
jgi:pimeloyl-ACP methyl ester carboxylesterase